MKRQEHFKYAEHLLDKAQGDYTEIGDGLRMAAMVHATLSAAPWDVADGSLLNEEADG